MRQCKWSTARPRTTFLLGSPSLGLFHEYGRPYDIRKLRRKWQLFIFHDNINNTNNICNSGIFEYKFWDELLTFVNLATLRRPPEALLYFCPGRTPKITLKSTIIWASNPLFRTRESHVTAVTLPNAWLIPKKNTGTVVLCFEPPAFCLQHIVTLVQNLLRWAVTSHVDCQQLFCRYWVLHQWTFLLIHFAQTSISCHTQGWIYC